MGKVYTFIHKDKINTKVFTSKLQEYLEEGWELGNWNQEELNAKSGAGVKKAFNKMREDGTWTEWSNKRNRSVSEGLHKFWSEIADDDYIQARELKKNATRDAWTEEEKELYHNKMSLAATLDRARTSPEEYHRRSVKGVKTKKNNGTFKVSKYEKICHDTLKEVFGNNDVLYIYNTDKRYPFDCDFYIKSLDLFIELNIHPSHGEHRFDTNREEDIKYKKLLEETNNEWSNMILDVWCNRDVSKYNYAINNKLNYIQIYSDNFDSFINDIRKGKILNYEINK